jgi:hypothetical protein
MAWVEKAHDFPGVLVKPSHIRPLEAVAMHASEGEIFKLGFAAVLACDDVVYLKRRRVKRRGQAAVFTTSRRSLPDPLDEVSIQYAWLSSRALQSAASFRLHDSEEITDMEIAVELGLFLACQFALASQRRQLVHARDIALAKTN